MKTIAWKAYEPVAIVKKITISGINNFPIERFTELKEGTLLYSSPRNLTDEEWNKAFDFYCETDEGVLRFDLELRDEWKKEQLIRWKEAIRKAQEK